MNVIHVVGMLLSKIKLKRIDLKLTTYRVKLTLLLTVFGLMTVLFVCPCALLAQQSEPFRLSGVVTSAADGSPLAGVSVRIQGTKVGAVTDREGRFTMAPNRATGTLTVSYLGYKSTERPFDVAGGELLHINLDPQENSLDETVIIAYGETTRRFNTGSVGKVTAAEIARQPVANPLAALQGRVPGLEVTQLNGRTDGGFTVMIRGQSSIASGNEPLYLIDGVPWLSGSISQIGSTANSQNPFNSLNPQDIQSIEVLKDADATAIYGSRGANGVILITTKKGKLGSTEVNLNAYTGVSSVGNTTPMMNTEQYLEMRREALANQGLTPTNTNAPDLLLYDQERYTDWKKLLLGNTAKLSDVQLSLSGGNEHTQFRLAGAYRRQTNVYAGENENRRGSAQFNLTHLSSNKRLRAVLTTNYSNDNNQLPPLDLTSGIFHAPNLKVYEDDGSIAWSENGSANRNNIMSSTLQSMAAVTDNLVSNLNVSYKVLNGLEAKINSGYTNTQMQETRVHPLVSYLPSASRASGDSRFARNRFKGWIVEPQLHYSQTTGVHSVGVLLGASWQEEQLQGTSISASNYSSEELLHTTAGAATLTALENYSLYRYQSIFGRINYRYHNRYLLNLTGRRDGSSRFGPGRQFANFGAIGAAWIFSEESLIKHHLPALSFGKLRGSYGITGNDKIGDYQYMDTYGSVSYPYNGISGLAPQRLYNAGYGWESNRKLEAALDLGFIRDRILFSASWFRNRSGSQLLQYTLPTQTGFSGITRNLPALVENRGWEFELNTINVQNGNFQWSSSFNLTAARNELLEFLDLESSSYASSYALGHSLRILKLYPYIGVNAESGLWEVDLDAGRSQIKDLTTRFYGGFNNSFQYKGVQLDVFLQFVSKDARDYLYSLPALPGLLNFNMPVALLDRWRESGDVTDIQRFGTAGAAGTARNNYNLSDGTIVDASFVRVKNVALSYSFPARWTDQIKVKQVRIYFQGQNLLTLTRYEGHDPEVTNMSTLPPLRMLTIGTQLTF